MIFRYCPDCGNVLVPKVIGDEGEVPFCDQCSRPFFPLPSPCVICLCIDENDDILLIKQSYGKRRFVCVAGYIKPGESAEDACKREISEETGLAVSSVCYLYSRYFDRNDNLMLAFVCRVGRAELTLSQEVSEAEWFTADDAYSALFEGAYGRTMIEKWRELRNGGAPV